VAICTAVAQGKRRFRGIAIVTQGGGVPCGACRQFLAEFCDDATPIFMIDASNSEAFRETTLGELLPQAFRLR
jgi:cytidine deaminase